MNSKFEKNLNELLDAQIITPEILNNITEYYNTNKTTKTNWLFTVFGVLGAILSGLGIILIVAHNWDTLPKNTKTILAFLPLVIGQIALGYSYFKNKSSTWKEASSTFLFFAIGATISLVSQVYNIPGKMSSFILTWTILATPLIYLMRSNLVVILHLIMATSYACNLGYFNANTPWLYVMLFALVLPHYYKLIKQQPTANITSILNWLLPLSLVISLGAFIGKSDVFGFSMYITLFGLLYNLGKLPWLKNQKLRVNGYLIIGSIGSIFTLTFTSFNWFWEDTILKNSSSQEIGITLFLFLSAIAVLLYLYLKKQLKPFNLFQYTFLIFGLIFLASEVIGESAVVLINILIFVLGLFAIKIGTNKRNYGILNYGLLIITILITCRFFDTNLDFIVRGLLFILVGVGFFLANYMLLKKQQNEKNNLIN